MAVTEYADLDDLGNYGVNAAALAKVPEEVKQKGISAASRVIDSYLRAQFTLPLLRVGEDIKRACSILAVYDLMVVRGYNPEAVNEDFRLRYEDVLKWLGRIADGKAVPDVTDSDPGNPEGRPSAGPRVATSSQRGWSSRGSSSRGSGFTGD